MMSDIRFTTSASSTVIYACVPQGRRITGRVKVLSGIETSLTAHPKKPHRWHEMLHYGRSGTGFAECRCGAIGVPFGYATK